MTFKIQAECPCCGQIIIVNSPESQPDKETLFALAAEKCDCNEAAADRGIRATEKAFDSILGSGGGRTGL